MSNKINKWEDRLDKLAILSQNPLSYSVMAGSRTVEVDYDELRDFINSELSQQAKAIEKEVEKTDIEYAHTYASENADTYRAYDAGQLDFKKRILSILKKYQ